tara:strand:+ start:260 stop:541 length:282 start_codon:yes stop_codon:yes gene_type:complete
MNNLKLKKEVINIPTEVEHFGWVNDDVDFGELYPDYKTWIEKKCNLLWEDYSPGMYDHDTLAIQDFCDEKNLNINCHYDNESDGIYLIKKKEG